MARHFVPTGMGRHQRPATPGLLAGCPKQAAVNTLAMYAKRVSAFVGTKPTVALLDRLTQHCRVVETVNETWQFR